MNLFDKRKVDIYRKLVGEYKIDGVEIRFGFGPNKSFIYAYVNGELLSTGAGICIQELNFFNILLDVCHPQRIYGVGNAFGWSTLGFAFSSPSSKIVVIDNLSDGRDVSLGMDETRVIIQRNNLNVEVIVAESPKDSSRIIQEHLNGKVDFVFIDGLHTNEQVVKDFEGVQDYLHQDSVVVFHDVVRYHMEDGFKEISSLAENNGFTSTILSRTFSGMGIVYNPGMSKIDNLVDMFFGS